MNCNIRLTFDVAILKVTFCEEKRLLTHDGLIEMLAKFGHLRKIIFLQTGRISMKISR